MTGFKNNVLGGAVRFLQRLEGDIDADLKSAIAILHPSVVAVEAEIKAHGPELLQAVAAAMGSAALSAVTDGTGTALEIASAAGKAAIAAGTAVAAAQGKELATDALHAIATAQVSAAQAAAPATPAN